MKFIQEMSQLELGAFVHTCLKEKGINVILSGGAVVSLYSQNRYISNDLDFVNIYSIPRREIIQAMSEMGFVEEGRHFIHPDSRFIIEFPPGPLTIGEEPVKQIDEIMFSTGSLRLLSPTDCVKDRLAAFYHWNDRQCLDQAEMVAREKDIDIEEIRRWSRIEGESGKFKEFLKRLMQPPAR